MVTELIVYACPAGTLAEQITEYREKVYQTFGRNHAHEYPPHCTLTGFVRDQESAIHDYVNVLDQAVAASSPPAADARRGRPEIRVSTPHSPTEVGVALA